MFHVPAGPNEPTYRGCVTKTNVCGNGCNPSKDPTLNTGICINNTLPMQWRLRQDEAVVIVGLTPPPSLYYSITTYLMSSYYTSAANMGGATAIFVNPIQKLAVSCPPGPARCSKFASLNQPLNMIALEQKNNGSSFNQPFSLIISGSKTTANDIKVSIKNRLNLTTFIHPLPTDILNMGIDNDQRDVFTALMRVAYPLNESDVDQYYSKPPFSVFRVTPTNNNTKIFTLSTTADITYIPRVTNQNETSSTFNTSSAPTLSNDALISALNDLETAIKTAHNKIGNSGGVVSKFLKPFFVNGIDCVLQGTECNGDCPDTLYPISENIYTGVFCDKIPVNLIGILCSTLLVLILIPILIFCFPKCSSCSCFSSQNIDGDATEKNTKKYSCLRRLFWSALYAILILAIGITATQITWSQLCQSGNAARLDNGKNDLYVVYGVNHDATGLSRYSSVTAYYNEKLIGIKSVSSSREYQNSANVYLGSANPSAPYLFAYRFARNCTDSQINQTLSSTSDFCFSVGIDGVGSIPKDGQIFFIERMYVSKKSNTGPAYNETIPARVLHFF